MKRRGSTIALLAALALPIAVPVDAEGLPKHVIIKRRGDN